MIFITFCPRFWILLLFLTFLGGRHFPRLEWISFLVDVILWSGLLLLEPWLGSSVAQPCPTLCNPMDCSTPGLPVHHQLLELSQTHVHRVSDAIQPSHPLSPPSPPAFSLSQHQGLFQWVSSSPQVSKVLEFQLQHQSFQWTLKNWFPSGWTGWISLQSKGLKSLLQHHSSKASVLQCSESQLVGLFFFFKCPVLEYSICLNCGNDLKKTKIGYY